MWKGMSLYLPKLSAIFFILHKIASTVLEYPSCTEYQCKSGECISEDKLCDTWRDCRDGSDEQACCEYEICFQSFKTNAAIGTAVAAL